MSLVPIITLRLQHDPQAQKVWKLMKSPTDIILTSVMRTKPAYLWNTSSFSLIIMTIHFKIRNTFLRGVYFHPPSLKEVYLYV